jgi:hypothetical protein
MCRPWHTWGPQVLWASGSWTASSWLVQGVWLESFQGTDSKSHHLPSTGGIPVTVLKHCTCIISPAPWHLCEVRTGISISQESGCLNSLDNVTQERTEVKLLPAWGWSTPAQPSLVFPRALAWLKFRKRYSAEHFYYLEAQNAPLLKWSISEIPK